MNRKQKLNRAYSVAMVIHCILSVICLAGFFTLNPALMFLPLIGMVLLLIGYLAYIENI